MNQHYVPKVYLKNFAIKNGREYYVNVYDKIEDKSFKANIKNICAETDLYTLDKNNSANKHILAIEKIYSDTIEPLFDKAYKILTDDSISKITNLQRVEILVGVFQLYFRNPILFRKKIEDHSKELQRLYNQAKINNEKGISYMEEDFSFREWDLEKIERFITNKLINIFKEKHLSGTAEIAQFHNYSIFEIQKIENGVFLTNDNPLFLEDMVSENQNPLLKSNEFNIPINKNYLFRIYHDKTKQHNFIYRRKTARGNAHLINDEIYNRGSRFIIGEKESFQDYLNFKEIIDDTSLDRKVNFIKRILSNKELIKENPEASGILDHYYNRYLINNTLTDFEELEMINKIKEMNRKVKINKIK